MKNLNILVIALFLSGCNAYNSNDSLSYPPNTLCEPNEQLLICNSSDLTECDGYLKDKSLIILEEIEL